MLRDTDVKKHLGRTVRRSSSDSALDTVPDGGVNEAPRVEPVPVTDDVLEKVDGV